MKIYLNRSPRSFALVSNGYALILRHPGDDLSTPKCIIEFVPVSSINLNNYKQIARSKCYGFLGLLNVKTYVYLGIVTNIDVVASPRPTDRVNRITGVEFFCLNSNEWDYLIDRNVHPELQLEDLYSTEYPCSSVRRLLSQGSFFYSRDFDITSNFQERGIKSDGFHLVGDGDYFKRFNWNNFMNSEFFAFRGILAPNEKAIFDGGGFLTLIMRGYAQTVNTIVGKYDALLTIISKQSCLKSGPLYGPWGVDDDGNVSNYAESEIILYTEKYCFAYVTVRGNVPIFWELDNQLLSSPKVEFPRSFDITQHAFQRHFEMLTQQFGEVHIINTLSNRNHKGELSGIYKAHFERSRNPQLTYTEFSVKEHNKRILDKLGDAIVDLGAFFYDVRRSNYIGKQLGVFRVNCLECLEKSNLVQESITKEVIELALRDFGITATNELWNKYSRLWEDNGKYLGRINASSISTKSTLKSNNKGISGLITKKLPIPGMADSKAKQIAIDKLLGRIQDQVIVTLHDPIHDFVVSELERRVNEFSSSKNITIFSGTFNVNGSTYSEDINSWIFPLESQLQDPPDIVFIGLQEVIELTPGQILNSDNTNLFVWENHIRKCLNRKCKYVSLWAGQLGGIGLLLYVKESEIENIKNVQGSVKKTGLGGMSANKGGVAVSFSFSSTSFCFVVSHLAAGMNNIDERHNDYKTLSKGIRFSRNRKIKDHDAVIWLGDFNYRISLTNEIVRPTIEEGNFGKLFEFDQLNNQMVAGETFPYFDEMEIKFPPTYKFDNGTQTYDTSEKSRVPAWTDRVLSLSRNKILSQRSYGCVPDIIFSDHRPVYATFMAQVLWVDEAKKIKLAQNLHEQRKSEVGDVNDLITASYLNEITLTHGFPPPSSDRRKWWIDGGQSAKVHFSGDSNSSFINPHLPVNPFEKSTLPEFIQKVIS